MPGVNGGSHQGKAVRVTARGLLIVCTVLAVACMVGSSGPERVDPAAFAWNAPISAPATVYIRNTNGSVEVRPSTDGNVRVSAELRWRGSDSKRDVKFETVNGANGVTICALWGGGTCGPTNYHSSHKVSGLLGNHTTESVAFTVYVPTGVRVDARTVNGAVGVAATAAVVARSVNGTIKVATSVGPVDAETVNGNVDVRMTTLGDEGPVRASTVTGAASAYLPVKFNGVVDISSTIGQVSSDFDGVSGTGEAKHLSGILGAGGRRVDVSTITGSASLRRLNADGTAAAP
jgi:hypothetical protein